MPPISKTQATEPWKYPKLLYNVNVPPQVANSFDEQKQFSAAWVDFTDQAAAVIEQRQSVVPPPDVPPVELNPTGATLTAAGGSGSFHVTITGPGISGTWTVTKDASADWLAINSPTTPQDQDGDVDYSVMAHADTTERTANLYVNGQTFTVTQEAAPA